MQLIGEPESILDIEMNMSNVENIQNNKTDDLKTANLNIENLQDKIVNRIDRDFDLNGDYKCVERKEEEVVSVIHDTSADVPMNISNNEVELSNADLGEIETIKNEEMNGKSQNCINGLDSVQNDVVEIDGTKETEEDYLEDDIISIIEEPLTQVTLEGTETENVIFERHVPIKEDVEDDKKEHVKFVGIAVVGVVKDEEEIEGHTEQSTTDVELQSPLEEIDSDHVMTEGQETSSSQGEKETNTPRQEEDTLRTIAKIDSISVQNESPIPPSLNENDKIYKSIDTHVSIDQVNEMEPVTTVENNEGVISVENTKPIRTENSEAISTAENNDAVSITEINETGENNKTVGVLPEENHSLACEKNIVSLTEQSKRNDIRIIDKVESTVLVNEGDKGHIDISEESDENSEQSNNVTGTEIDKEAESTILITDTLVLPSREAHDIENIEDLNTAGDQDENQNESHTEVKETENIIEPTEVVNTEKAPETSKCDSNGQDSNTKTINTYIDVEKVTEDTTIAEDPKTCVKDDKDVNSSTSVTTTTVNTEKPIICKLSNTLDILSDDDDDDEELPQLNLEKAKSPMADSSKPLEDANNKCINLEADDDIMIIDEDTDKAETKSPEDTGVNKEIAAQTETNPDLENLEKTGQTTIALIEPHNKDGEFIRFL